MVLPLPILSLYHLLHHPRDGKAGNQLSTWTELPACRKVAAWSSLTLVGCLEIMPHVHSGEAEPQELWKLEPQPFRSPPSYSSTLIPRCLWITGSETGAENTWTGAKSDGTGGEGEILPLVPTFVLSKETGIPKPEIHNFTLGSVAFFMWKLTLLNTVFPIYSKIGGFDIYVSGFSADNYFAVLLSRSCAMTIKLQCSEDDPKW